VSTVQRYWAGALQRLRAEVDIFSSLLEHYGERGRANELAFAQVLERFLPSRWAVGTGIVVDRHGRQSRQMDIVIFERSDEAAIFAQSTQLLHPVETVIACVEIKTTLAKHDIEVDFKDKKASLAALDPAPDYVGPLFLLVAYNAEVSPAALAGLLHSAVDARPDIACVLSRCTVAGTREALDLDAAEYSVGSCLQQLFDEDGRFTGDFARTDSHERQVVSGGVLVPVVRREDGERFIGDPGRALLLVMEALSRTGAVRRGQRPPVLSVYLDDMARARLEIEPA
jgi:hypothetical protein